MTTMLYRYCKVVAKNRVARLLAALIVIATLLMGLSVKTDEPKKVRRFVICNDELIISVVDDVVSGQRTYFWIMFQRDDVSITNFNFRIQLSMLNIP